MSTSIVTTPSAAQSVCVKMKAYAEWYLSWSTTAEAEKTITSPVTTSTSVVKNSHLSTPTRFAIYISLPVLLPVLLPVRESFGSYSSCLGFHL